MHVPMVCHWNRCIYGIIFDAFLWVCEQSIYILQKPEWFVIS